MAKIPEKMFKYCAKCKTHSTMKVKQVKSSRRKGGLSATARKEKIRRRGYGNLGKYSKKPVTQTKMASKASKKTDLRLTCPECKKIWTFPYPRTKRVEFVKV